MKKKSEKQAEIVDTIVGINTLVEGTIKTDASMRVEGKVNGEIYCQGDLTVGAEGVVNATINGRNIRIAGEVIGDIKATGTVHIESKGKLVGNIHMKSFIIDEGGIFEGQSKMNQEDAVVGKKEKKEKVAN
jgi:cytoskeletal protein CcmA (bactofilin family)